MQPAMSGRKDSSGLLIRLLLLVLVTLGVIGILLLAPAEAATVPY